MIFSNQKQTAIQVNQTNSKKSQKLSHPVLRPLVSFWRFSCYYADYKARIWDVR